MYAMYTLMFKVYTAFGHRRHSGLSRVRHRCNNRAFRQAQMLWGSELLPCKAFVPKDAINSIGDRISRGFAIGLATRFAPGCYAFRYGVRFGSLLITLQKNAATCEVARMFRGFDAGLCIKLWFFSVFTPLIFTDIYPLLVFPTTVRLPQVPFEPGMKIERVRLEPRPCSRPPWRDDPIGQGSDSRRITRYYEFVRVSLCQNMPNVTVNCNMYNARGDMKSIAPHENGLKMQGMRF